MDPLGRDCAGRSYLHRAASNGQTARVASLLQQEGTRLDLRDNLQRTPVFAAAKEGHWDIVWTLLSAGAPADPVGGESDGLLRLAVLQGEHAVPERLLAEGVPVDEPDPAGQNALSEAARAGDQAAVAMLLARGARLGERAVEKLVTDLVVAGDIGTLTLLCERGLSLKRRAIGGESLVDLAWERRDLRMATLLVEHDAPLQGAGSGGPSAAFQEWLPLLLDHATTGQLDGALERIMPSGDRAAAELLLEHGATGRWALVATALDGDLEGNAWLRERGVRHHAEALDELVPDASVELIAQALADGAKVGGLALRKETPMDRAIKRRSEDLVQLLADHGAAVPDQAVEAATSSRDLAWLGVLIDAGGEPDPVDLKDVVRADDAELLALLLSAGPLPVDAVQSLRRTARKYEVSSPVTALLDEAIQESRQARRGE